MNFKYYLGAILTVPLLPIMYVQGKRIMARVPKLSEAKAPKGSINFLKSRKTMQLVVLGESTIAGVGVNTHEEGFTGTLATELSKLFQCTIDWNVYAKSGYTAQKITKKLVPKIKEDVIDLIVIGIGGNDAFKLNSPKKWRKSIHDLLDTLQSKYPATPIVFCNMPPIKEFPAFTTLLKNTMGTLVEILGKELQKAIIDYNDVYYYGEIITLAQWIKRHELKASKADFFSDGVHPSQLTYQTWAKEIAAKIFNTAELKNVFVSH
ncbi:MAG: SGNH/GDSL hydrolase family protein [Cellulophaga sp.]|nr:SGNH/GDSL hydrolase family protein [Cellulophaga sp.]